MSDQVTPFTISDGEWITVPTDTCYHIIRTDTQEIIAVADENGDAALMACAKDFLNTLIAIQERITTQLPDGSPIEKDFITGTEIQHISALINAAFAKIANEVAV
jgi:hypothetical protein